MALGKVEYPGGLVNDDNTKSYERINGPEEDPGHKEIEEKIHLLVLLRIEIKASLRDKSNTFPRGMPAKLFFPRVQIIARGLTNENEVNPLFRKKENLYFVKWNLTEPGLDFLCNQNGSIEKAMIRPENWNWEVDDCAPQLRFLSKTLRDRHYGPGMKMPTFSDSGPLTDLSSCSAVPRGRAVRRI
jgi:hypothetical protein